MADWGKVLEQAVEDRWKEGHVFLIAQVKPFLVKQGFDVDALLEGRQVRAFLESDMPSLQHVQNEREPTNWGLAPAKAKIEPPASRYFEKRSQRRAVEFPFQNALRVAFSRPISDGQRRWFSVNPPRFVDLPAQSEQAGGLEIAPVEVDPDAPVDRLASKVEEFLRGSGLDPDAFRVGQAKAVAMPKGRTALHQLLNLIPPEELHRVTLPLDLVRQLLDRNDDTQR